MGWCSSVGLVLLFDVEAVRPTALHVLQALLTQTTDIGVLVMLIIRYSIYVVNKCRYEIAPNGTPILPTAEPIPKASSRQSSDPFHQ